MASIFTYNDSSRVSSPWSTPGSSTPQAIEKGSLSRQVSIQLPVQVGISPISLKDAGITKLEPEPQEGSTEYKLHLLLRPRRKFSSASTGIVVSGSQHSKASLSPSGAGAGADVEVALIRPSFMPSTQTRQARLQQLTTQLLWRLQQSSPFHSSSVANLVLPLLPEATPRLGLPTRPAKVLPGLEESQGALYEIGVADDGTLVGLIEEELEESLTNLKAMAASLGCVVELQRKVTVGDCEWTESGPDNIAGKVNAESLWVAEALVRPDLNSFEGQDPSQSNAVAKDCDSLTNSEALLSDTEQVRIAITGNSTSGKSSLLGVLTTSVLDNGRGKSRLSLLKHRHEIASGVTSSVAQELIGYTSPEKSGASLVVNYSSKDVSSWVDIHNLSHRLIFVSDSPGLSRYAKSTFRTLVSWDPHWTVVCVAADAHGTGGNSSTTAAGLPPPADTRSNPPGSTTSEEELDTAFTHLDLCLQLDLPLVIATTKMDQATKPGLRATLAKLLSIVKGAGKKPVLLNNAPVSVHGISIELGDLGLDLQHILVSDSLEVEQLVKANQNSMKDLVPLIFTSAVTGVGISKLHALLKSLPCPESAVRQSPSAVADKHAAIDVPSSKVFHIDEVFMIPPSKVYSNTEHNAANQGIVLCGFVKRGSISIGDELMLGPFLVDAAPGSLRRSSSYNARNGHPLAGRSLFTDFARSLQVETPLSPSAGTTTSGSFRTVRVVSLRNLRLPVRSLLPGQVGTIGVIPLIASANIQRARKGMILTKASTVPTMDLTAHRIFTASFPASDFASPSSPPLILGGHALVYVNSVRAAVKVTAVTLAESEAGAGPASPDSSAEFFAFDSDGSDGELRQENDADVDAQKQDMKEIKITFRFTSSVECLQLGDRVLVVPTASAAGPVTGPAVAATGLSGFVGRVCELVG